MASITYSNYAYQNLEKMIMKPAMECSRKKFGMLPDIRQIVQDII
jgi:hypothetical protein